ncbi:UNVERIFIED_CONTAM: hypothetical protein K2H54_003464, partial [Gekko kuhli]
MLGRGDCFLSEAESDPVIMKLATNLPGASMTYRLAMATGHDPKLSGEKTARKRPQRDDGTEDGGPRMGASDGGHVEAQAAPGSSQLQDANLQAGCGGTYSAQTTISLKDPRRQQM